MRKTERMATAVSEGERNRIREAARVLGVSPSEYLRATALERAREIKENGGRNSNKDN